MTRPTAWASKGLEVEEWADRRFFRPLGYAIARWLAGTRVTADQVTIAGLAVGLIAGHLFVYADPRLNCLGVALFVSSDVLDSADGQLARLRGTSSRAGRMLDGVADNLRFVNLYVHLILRLMEAGWGWEAVALAAAWDKEAFAAKSAADALKNLGAASPEALASQDCLDVSADADTRVLVFSHTAGFRHESIEVGVEAVHALGERYGFDRPIDPRKVLAEDRRRASNAFLVHSLIRRTESQRL